MVFERHTRIKILTEGGYDWGTVSIPYYAENKTQVVRSIKGQTFTPGSGGKAKEPSVLDPQPTEAPKWPVRFRLDRSVYWARWASG